MFNDISQIPFIGNPIINYVWFVCIILGGIIFQKLLSKALTYLVFKILQKYSKGVGYDKLLELMNKPMGVFIILMSLYFAFDRLTFPVEWNFVSIEHFGLRMVLSRLFQITIAVSVTWMILRLTDFFGLVLMFRASLTESKSDDQLVPFIKEALKVIIMIFSLFFILGTIFELNIASLVAGLGIGGLAIALAAKESLENLLGSFTIFLDKPFVIGDLVRLGSLEGHVEKIGFRSTRIRTLEKSYVTVPNKKLIDSELDNLSLRIQRRAKFNIGLTYETSSEKFKIIISEIKKFIDDHPNTLNGETRVRLHEFDASAIVIMIVYFVDTLEYDVYLDVREEINYKIIEIVKGNGSNFAYPTTAVVMKNKLVDGLAS
jgi:MscS family membrane protein